MNTYPKNKKIWKLSNFWCGGKSGMTLIETILYLGIVVFVLSALFSYGWNVTALSVKTEVIQKTVETAQLIGGRLRFEIRRAENVDRTASVFGATPAKLVLQGNETVIIEDTGSQITIKRGSSEPIPIHSQYVQINNLVFTEEVSQANETDYIGFSFDAAANYPGSSARSEYQYSSSFRSGSALRVSR